MKEFIEKLIGRLEEKFKYNSEQAEIYRDGSDKDAYFREKKDLYMDRANTYGQVMHIVNQLAEEYKGGWIPCSERLPENTDLGYFLVWCKGYFTEGTHIGEECQWYGIGLLYNKNKWEVYQCKDIKDIEVIAWQPLPAPYKKGE